jgi:hypothetical protein
MVKQKYPRDYELWVIRGLHHGPKQGMTKRFPTGVPIATLLLHQEGIEEPGADAIAIQIFHLPMNKYKGAKFLWGNEEWVIKTYDHWDSFKRWPHAHRHHVGRGERLAEGYMIINARRVK